MNETQFAGAVYLLAKAIAEDEGLSWVDPWKVECLDRATFVLSFLEENEMLAL